MNRNPGGRPRSLQADQSEWIRALYLEKKLSLAEILEQSRISRSTFFNYKKQWDVRSLRVGINNQLNAPAQFYHKHGLTVKRAMVYDLIFARLLARFMDVEICLVPCRFANLFDKIALGQIDIGLANIARTPERESRFGMSLPYGFFEAPVSIGLVSAVKRSQGIPSPDLRLGVVGGTIHQHYALTSDDNRSSLRSYHSIDTAISALRTGHVNALWTHHLSVVHLVVSGKVGFEAYREISDAPTCAIVRQDRTDLLNEVNLVISRLKASGLLADLSRRFVKGTFSEDYSHYLREYM